MLCLGFTNPDNSDIELIKGGKDMDLTIHNLQDYIDLVLHSTFQETVNMQLAAFKKGFNTVLPIEALRKFCLESDELVTLICGSEGNNSQWTDADFLKTVILPDRGFKQQSEEYQFFIRMLTELESQKERADFLRFVTGSNRLPHGGFGALDPQMTVSPNTGKEEDTLPTVNTCLHYIKIPKYSSYEMLKNKFKQAIEEGGHYFAFD